MDFYELKERITTKPPITHIYPDFKYAHVKDLVCKGGSMYAFWDEDHWDTSMDDMIVKIDNHTRAKVKELKSQFPEKDIRGSYFNSNSSKIMTNFDSYAKLRTQSDVPFNTKIIFSEDQVHREDYSTTKLGYTPSEGPSPAFDELIGLLYSEKELEKILWFVGALLTNNMSRIQKFMYLYGSKGSGKGTVISIIKMLFDGYYSAIDLAHLTSGSEFATGQIKELPLLIDEDSDISRISKDTNLLKLTAHEPVSVNAKYRQTYDVTFTGLLITASNQRFKVRNIDSGITRRAVVVEPTTEKHDSKTYMNLMDRVKYELPMIADKAMKVFEEKGPYYYEGYMDVAMVEATDHVFSFVREHAGTLGDPCSLKVASELYKVYLEDIGFETKGYKRKIKNELSRYYREFFTKKMIDGERYNNIFVGFKRDVAFPDEGIDDPAYVEPNSVEDFGLDAEESTFDKIASTYQAQPANSYGTPKVEWDKCNTTLKDIDTSELHFVRLPLNHIVIDFDIKGDDGEKDLIKNLKASQKFPETYMELSKSGKGVHLHYIYDGAVEQLADIYEDDVEIKVFTGKQSLRRKLTKHNDLPITHIQTGLPKKDKDGGKVYQDVAIISWNEKKMRTAIKNNLMKKYHSATKPSVDFIKEIFDQAVANDVKYDLRDMRQDIMTFATQSTNNSMYCMKVINSINFCTIDEVEDTKTFQAGTVIIPDEDIYFYDIEVFQNLFVVCWKRYGAPAEETFIWINPTSKQIESLLEKPLIGFNNRRYDNHILYASMLGEENLSLYRQSQRIINDKDSRSGMYSGAYELSYADIYEYSATKMSLKKWEVELGIKHDELELPWDQPVPEEMWQRVGEYCVNDVVATEAVFNATHEDYMARKILAELSGLKINATTQQHAAKFLFGDDRRPQDKFIYTDLSEEFPGYKFEYGKSEYKGIDPKEGGYVYSEPGIYKNVALLDVVSMHPHSLIALNHFGPYTQRFADLVQTRVYIKNGEFDKAREMFGGILKPYLEDEKNAKALAYALKIIINIVYGMTSAKFDNPFKHPKNLDNIVAKRGALFMIDLKEEVQKRGFTVAHVKTDSIKIPDATDELIEFIHEFGKKYGYEFEHEETYKKFALVNKAVYIAELEDGEWSPTGTMFRQPYVFKKLCSGEEIVEEDYAILKQATAPIYLGDHYVGKVANVYASKTGDEMRRVEGEKVGAITGTKNFKWRLFSDYQGKEDIDMSYYDHILNDAITALNKVGDINDIFPGFEKENISDEEVEKLVELLKDHLPEEITDDKLPF